MPTSGYSFTSQEITVRFRAPYISESLNQQFRGIVSAGVYEGFNPQVSGTPLHIELATDPSGRSSAVAVSDLNPTTSVSVHVAGTIDLDLSAYASKTVAVCVDLHYAFPADTTGTVNIYDLGTETVPATSCVLAKVVVPAAGLIPAANINIDDRSFPFLSRGRDATPMVSVVRNGAPYLTHDLVGLPDFWDSASLTAMTYIASSAVLAPSGFNLAFRAQKNAAGLGSVSGTLLQKIGLPVPTNRRLRLTVAFRPSVVPSVGNPVLSATITDAAGVTITTVTLQLDSAVVGVWETYSTTVQLPAVTTTAAVVKEVFVQCSAVSYTTVGVNAPIFDIADVDLQLEQHGPATDAIPEISGESHHTKVRLYEDAFPGAEYAQLTFDGATTLLTSSLLPAAHTFQIDGNLVVTENFTVGGDTFLSNIDAPAPVDSGPVTIGAVNATEVVIGRAGKNVKVVDTLLVNTVLNPDSAKLFVVGDFSVQGGLKQTTGTVDIQTGSTALIRATGGVVVWGGASPAPTPTFGEVLLGSQFLDGVSISAGSLPASPGGNNLLLNAVQNMNMTSSVISVGNAVTQRVTTQAGRLAFATIAVPTVPSAGGISIEAAANVVIVAQTLLASTIDIDLRAADDIKIAATGGGVSIFAGGSSPAPIANALLISAASTVNLGSTSLAAAVVEAIDIDIAASTGDALLRSASGGVVVAAGVPPAPTAGNVIVTAASDILLTPTGAIKTGGATRTIGQTGVASGRFNHFANDVDVLGLLLPRGASITQPLTPNDLMKIVNHHRVVSHGQVLGGTMSFLDSSRFNATASDSVPDIVITFSEFVDFPYTVLVAATDAMVGRFLKVNIGSTSAFSVSAYDHLGNVVDLTSTGGFYFVVIGRSDFALT